MVQKRPLELEDMEAVDRRIAGMGRELYRLIEDYPILDRPDWGYAASLMLIHQRIYDEAMALKHSAIASQRDLASGSSLGAVS